MAKSKSPTRLTIRAYQVGFGDCFLLTFHYPPLHNGESEDKHVLIDCGSTGRPKNAPSLKQVALQIEKDCAGSDGKGKLTAVVATHRHADHINGFATNDKEDGSGDILRRLKPDVVLQPWTEHPDLAKDAKTLPKSFKDRTKSFGATQFVSGLEGMHLWAQLVQKEAERLRTHLTKSLADQLSFLGEENLHNLSAVKNLMRMGKVGKAEYLRYGDKTSLERKLPGVKIHVLGPPDVEQYPDVAKQKAKDASEFWHILGVSGAHRAAGTLSPFKASHAYARGDHPPESRWLISRIRALHGAQRLALVRALDDAMNNTSLILLFEIGDKRFLFPGDAQLENWSYALEASEDKKDNAELLKHTNFYKVGHHGSLNATPKELLWKLFQTKGGKTKKNRLKTIVSTMAGKHGKAASRTEVPRKTLVEALKTESDFFSTQDLKKKNQFFHDEVFKLE